MKLFRFLLNRKILTVSSAGGHLAEVKHALKLSEKLNYDITFVTNSNEYTKKSLAQTRHFFINDPHTSKIMFMLNAFYSLIIFVQVRPRVVFSSGAGMCIPLLLIGKIFGSYVVFIETGACVTTPSKTGRFVYKFADLFMVQYRSLLKFYPNASVVQLL